jgi:hypothetical protein
MSSESAETYLRQFAENLLRRVADGKLTSDECSSRVHAVATAFESTGALDAALADSIRGDVEVALAARSPDAGTLMHLGRRAPFTARPGLAGVSHMVGFAMGQGGGKSGSHEGSFGGIEVVPAGAVLRVRGASARDDSARDDGTREDGAREDGAREDGAREDGGDEDIYLLGLVSRPGRAWLTVAARTNERPARRPASPPSARNAGARRPTPSTFAGGGMTAVDDAGRRYDLGFSGGGGKWYLGRLTLNPAPPADIGWLDVHCGTESVRVDMRARAAAVEVTVQPSAASRAEAYLLQRAETLLASPALVVAEAAGMADAVPALRACGALADDSPVPGQVAALHERLGAPGHKIASPGPLPERWASFLSATRSGTGPWTGPWTGAGPAGSGTLDDADVIDAARLAVTLPAGGGRTIVLAGLITGTGGVTVIFGGLYLGADRAAAATAANLSMWLRDDAGGWHSASISGWSSDGSNGVSFQAVVLPPLSPATRAVEFYVAGLSEAGPSGAGPTEEIRAAIPLEWWSTS